ncbi:WD40 repeat-like protein [Thelephora ganbajun]|uniref:WD40 repeat-like protein n=1 Tax=Thelephora ganbajun TaxID=370292 RepID=A0ACB6ZYU4_THEGA|nr:WD40 repeat-like protein [Thelephora ganbajun]
MAIVPNIITADEVNCLVYSYLKDSGFHHAAFAIKSEGHLDRSPNFSKHIPRGELVDLLSKALLYIEVETHWCEGSLTLNCRAPFSLLDKHTCDIDGTMKPAALRIPPESTARLLNGLKQAPPAEEDEGTPRRVEEDGMDIDSQAQLQAGTSINTQEQNHEVPGVQLYDGSKSAVFVCGWSPTSTNILATGTKDALVHIWDIPPGSEDATSVTPLTISYFPSEDQRDITCLDWSPDGKFVATGAIDGRLRLCTPSAELYMGNAQQSQAILALKFSPSGKWLLAGGLNPAIQLWNVTNKTLEKQFPADNASCLDVAWIDDSRFVTCGGDKAIHVFQLNTTKPIRTLKGHTNDINQVKCNSSSTSLASCSDDGTARTWNLQTGTSVVCSGHTAELVHVQWCPRTEPGKDELIATCAKDATTRIWNSITGECLKVFTDHTESLLFALAFCPSGRWLATGGSDGDIHVYDMQSMTRVWSYNGGDLAGVFEIDWQNSADVSRFAFALESEKVGVVDLTKIPEFVATKEGSLA